MGRSLRFFWTLRRSLSRRARSLEMSSEVMSVSEGKSGESEDVGEGEERERRSSSATWSTGVSVSMMVLACAGCFTA